MVSIFENQKRKLHTTRSWSFLGMESDEGIPPNSIWKAARFGEDTIIGNLDTGSLSSFLLLDLQLFKPSFSVFA